MYVKLLTLLLLIKNVLSANILAVMVLPSHSHHLFNCKYLEALAARGHTITYLSIDKYENPPKNIRHLFVPNIYETFDPDFDFNTITSFWDNVLEGALLNSTKLKEFVGIIKNDKYDLVVADLGVTGFLLGASQFSNAPVMGITAFGIPQRIYDLLGNPNSIAINPHHMSSLDQNMNVVQRLDNFIHYIIGSITHYFGDKDEAEAAKKLFGDQTDMQEILNRLNVVLVNANLATDPKIPLVPGLIPIAGLHIQEPKPLPTDLQMFLDEAKDGVIYFSLGTFVPSTAIIEKIEMFTEAFKRLAPVKILWKYDNEDFPGKPGNVKVSKWLPQNDILAHPNVRLFFTHAGMLGSHEAIYHGVPMVALPIFIDQHPNAEKCVRQGICEKLQFPTLTTEKIYGTLKKVLDDPKYTEKINKLSEIFRDYPDKPLDRAIYWTEYVIRHKGAPHLRTATRNLYWFQNWLIDVALIVSSVILTALLIIYKFIKLLIPKSKKTKEKKN